jgi:uncharacterized protein (TIGR02597 family)
MKLFPACLRPAAVCAGLCSLLPAVFGATEATTDPVGFITLNVASGSAATPQYTLLSPTLLRPVDWQGTIGTISGKIISVANSPWTANQFNSGYFVEVTSGANAGAWSDIAATATGSITTEDSLSSFAAAGATIRIRKHVTLNDFLGPTNSAGLLGSDSSETADEVLIYDGAIPSIYWYSTIPGYTGWRDLSFNAAGSKIIAPNQGVAIKRKTSGAVTFVSSGTVKTGNTFIPIVPGYNVVGTIAAQGLTLATCGLTPAVGLQASDSAETADALIIYGGSTPAIYWYSNIPNYTGWRYLNFDSAAAVPITPGSSLVIQRKGATAFNWVVPAPTSF